MSRRRRRPGGGGIFGGGAGGIVTDGLVARWKFDEGTGATAADSVGGANFTSMTGSWVTGGFAGTGGPFSSGSGLGISGGAARTVVAVLKCDVLGTDNTRFGVEWPGNTPGTPTNGTRWTLRTATGTDDLRFENQGAGETESALNFNPDNQWAFVAAVQTGANMNTITLYKDAATPITLTTSSTINTAGNFQILAVNNASAGFTVGYLLVYNRALSAAEIAQNRAALTVIMTARGITLP